MATRLNNPGTRHFNSSGEPLTGGKLNFYEPGTTTRKNTYSDSALTTANANPVILLTGGLEPNIFLDGTYRVILTDADDVQIWDRDNVNAGSGAALDNWSSGVSYDTDDTVYASDGNFYISLVDDNLGNDPTSSPASWAQFEFINVTASEAGNLEDIAALSPADSTFLVGDGSNWKAESGATLRTSIGVGTGDTPQLTNVRLTGLATGYVVTANSAGGLVGVDMTTKGGLLVGDGSGAPSVESVGANDLGLVADSAQTRGVKWAPVGSMVLLSTATASSDAAVDFTSGIDSTYDEYMVELLNVTPATDNVSFTLQTSTDGGASWDSTSGDYEHVLSWSSVGTALQRDASATDTAIKIAASVGADANETGVSASLHLIRPSEATYTTLHFTGSFVESGASIGNLWGAGRRVSAADVNGLRFLFSSGNIASGEFKLYGVKK